MTYLKRRKRFNLIIIVLLGALLCIAILAATLGVANITFIGAIRIFLSKIPFIKTLINTDIINSTHELIIINIRMPRIIMSILVGAGLATAGCNFQSLFRNPMADPFVLGISSGSALGATLAIAFGLNTVFFFGMGITTLFAFLGAIISTIAVYAIAKVGFKLPTTTLLLAGIAYGFLMNAIITIIMVLDRDKIENIVYWMMGSFSAANWQKIIIITPVLLISIILLISFSRELNLLSIGDDSAKALGINVERVKKILLIITAVIIATCVSTTGIIGFVGLIIPHAVRIITGSNNRYVLPLSAIVGAIFLLICDTIARTIMIAELPVGAITSLFGAPFFIYLLVKRKRRVTRQC